MNALGRRQVSLLKTIIDKGEGQWPENYRIFSGQRVILDKLCERGLVAWKEEHPAGYVITETGRQALTLRGLL